MFGIRLVIFCAMLVWGMSASAYQPGVSDLEDRIQYYEAQLSQLQLDSTVSPEQLLSIKDSILVTKDKLVAAKEETISGLRRQQSMREDKRESLGMIAFVLTLVAILALVFVLLFSKRLQLQEGQGVFQLLASDLQSELSPEVEKDKSRFHVHFIVLLSVIIMFVSMCMYLFRVM